MYCIVIQKDNGKMIRETSEDKPDIIDIQYWEDFYSTLNTDEYIESAIVINIYEVSN